jgi:hypothetical protein
MTNSNIVELQLRATMTKPYLLTYTCSLDLYTTQHDSAQKNVLHTLLGIAMYVAIGGPVGDGLANRQGILSMSKQSDDQSKRTMTRGGVIGVVMLMLLLLGFFVGLRLQQLPGQLGHLLGLSGALTAHRFVHNLIPVYSLQKRKLAGFKVVKTYRDRSVYVVDNANTRHHIPDWSTFLSLGYDVSNIQTITDEAMAALTLGAPLDPIAEEPTPPNPFAGCPCVSLNSFLLTVNGNKGSSNKEDSSVSNKETVAKGTIAQDTTSSSSSHSAGDSSGLAKHHHVCVADNQNTATFYHRFPSLNLHAAKQSLRFSKVSRNFTQQGFRQLTSRPEGLKDCDLVMEFTKKTDLYKYSCPELCGPIPYVLVSLAWLEKESYAAKSLQDIPLTCSLTFRQLFTDGSALHGHHHSSAGNDTTTRLHQAAIITLQAIVQRRFEECFERDYWPPVTTTTSAANASGTLSTSPQYSSFPKRLVHGLIIWIGTRTRYDLMEDQIQILSHTKKFATAETFEASNAGGQQVSQDLVVGWMASEDQYPCRVGTTVCEAVTSSNAYFRYMPTTRMNFASSGWSCAQRRPLRSLAHSLLLYDADYVLVVDDDSFVSINILLSSPFKTFVRNELMTTPIVLGELTHGKKVTKRGFYYGGSGYLFGRVVIDRLNAFSLLGPKEATNAMIDPTIMTSLSVLNQVYPMSQQHCSQCLSIQSTATSQPPLTDPTTALKDPTSVSNYIGLMATSQVRAVELCVNVMAQEHTCFHSDHSMSRCLIHGVYAAPWDVECGSTSIAEDLRFAMCMGTDNCDSSVVLTCHRYRPHRDNPLTAYGMYDAPKLVEDMKLHRNFSSVSERIFERRRLTTMGLRGADTAAMPR